jgi:uncharacterized membrane protein (DUF485 family)
MLKNLPTWLRAAVITGAQAAAASLLLLVLDLILDVQDWLSDPTNPVDVSGAGKAALGVLFTLITFVVTAVYRSVRPVENAYPEPPK